MKLSKTIDYINTALNYPALTYRDLDLFFDMAIAELNSSLHIQMPTVSDMVDEFRRKMSKPEPNKVFLTVDPITDASIPTIGEGETHTGFTDAVYYDVNDKMYYILNKYTSPKSYTAYKTVKGVYRDTTTGDYHVYTGVYYASSDAMWVEVPTDPTYECNLEEYLPDDWVLLWLIPYVCFKYTVRDGGTAQTFAEELSEGHQQLQDTYNVPSFIVLATYAGRPAYEKLVEDNLPNLNIVVPTRAIYTDMVHSRTVGEIHNNFFDRGGF